MQRIVEDLDHRRRALFQESKAKIETFRLIAFQRARSRKGAEGDVAQTDDAEFESESLLSGAEWREFARWRNLARFQPPVIDLSESTGHDGGQAI